MGCFLGDWRVGDGEDCEGVMIERAEIVSRIFSQ